jgi:hypothetical protein
LPPPSPQDPSRDEVHRFDKSIHPGRLRSVDAASVFAAIKHDRKQVAWIWLTPTDVPPSAPTAGDLPSAAGQQPAPGTRTYEYDVTLHAVIKNEDRGQHTYRSYRTTLNSTREVTWTGTIRNVRITVTTIGSSLVGLLEPVNYDPSDRNSSVTEKWKLLVQSGDKPADASCEGNLTGGTMTSVNAGASNRSDSNLLIKFWASTGWSADDVIRADCNNFMAHPWKTPEFMWSGLHVRGDAGDYNTHLSVSFDRGTGGSASPVSELVTGRAFTLDTGTHTIEDLSCDPRRGSDPRDANNSCTAYRKYEQRYVATFTPRR